MDVVSGLEIWKRPVLFFIKFALVELCYLYILMRSIHLKHFRCYSDFRLVFKPGINLLVGDNASGKTSLLKACQHRIWIILPLLAIVAS